MRDFTLSIYRDLLLAFQQAGYDLVAFKDYISNGKTGGRAVILRHDVDRRPAQAVDMAEMEREIGASATYYFRIVPESFDRKSITRIAELGHEIGYHYEDLTLARGDVSEALRLFEKNLSTFQQFCRVTTICMHGSPLTRWDNRDLWTHADYRQYGVVAEPYFDLDFEQVLYVTDTSRAWNSGRLSRRDRVNGRHASFSSTTSMIQAVQERRLSDVIMINTHPERWSDDLGPWFREWFVQKLKNPAKFVLNHIYDRSQ